MHIYPCSLPSLVDFEFVQDLSTWDGGDAWEISE